MPQKTKLTLLEKISAVEDYLSGREGPIAICAKLNIAHATLFRWKQAYEEKGVSGLIPAERLKKYSVELKLQAVNKYLLREYDLCGFVQQVRYQRYALFQGG